MKLFRKVVDERQEHEMMRIERGAFWVMFFTLWLSVLVQLIVLDSGITYIAGEVIAGLLGAIWLLVGCIRNGFYDYYAKPGLKVYFLYSTVAAFIYAILLPLRNHIQYNIPFWGSVMQTFTIRFLSFFVIMFLAQASIGIIIKSRSKKLQQKYEDSE